VTPCCHHLVRYNGCNVDKPYLATSSLFATLYILTSVMSLPLLYPKGMDVLISNLLPCCYISLPYIMGFEIKIIHQRTQTIRWYASCCHHCHYCNVDFLSHATLILYYHASMLTLQTSLISHALTTYVVTSIWFDVALKLVRHVHYNGLQTLHNLSCSIKRHVTSSPVATH
jgi:hypothetical protein